MAHSSLRPSLVKFGAFPSRFQQMARQVTNIAVDTGSTERKVTVLSIVTGFSRLSVLLRVDGAHRLSRLLLL